MKKRRIALLLVCVLAVLTVWAFAAGSPSAELDEKSKIRVGTFNSRVLALANYRSAIFQRILKDRNSQADGNQKLAGELKAKAQRMQQRAYTQILGGAPIDNIIGHIKDNLPGVAKDAGVDLIAQQVIYQGSSVQIVDVTDQLVQIFRPDEETVKAIEGLLKQRSSGPARLPSDHPPVNVK